MSDERVPSASWKFVQHDERGRQRWKWLRTAAGGAIASGDFPSYAAAVMDAVTRGFRPKSEPYLVESPGRLVRFEPGRRPVTVWLPEAGSPAAGKRVAGTTRG